MRRSVTSLSPIVPVTAARAHVIGLVLLALLLQALSPLLHARLLSLHAAQTGQRIAVAAFCLPGHRAPAAADDAGGSPPRLVDCPLCVGGAAPAADLPAPSDVVTPPPSAASHTPAMPPATIRVVRPPAAHQPRGPPAV